jgi:CRP-like cAMP-binding protein
MTVGAPYLIYEGDAAREDSVADGLVRLKAGDLIGQDPAGLLLGQANVRTLSPLRGWAIPAPVIVRLCAQLPGLAGSLTHSLSRPDAAHRTVGQARELTGY